MVTLRDLAELLSLAGFVLFAYVVWPPGAILVASYILWKASGTAPRPKGREEKKTPK